MSDKQEYNASNITILKGLEAVRKRPAMYIGGTDEAGLHHMIWEIVDNGIDEALAGHATTVSVELNNDGSATIKDDGRGIPVDIHPVEKVSALQIAATVLHAGGKFDKNTYKVSSGLHGVGLSVVNALSEWCKIEVHKDGKVYFQEYKQGTPLEEVKVIGETNLRGTHISFKPDQEIFETTKFKYKTVHNRLRQHAYLNGGIQFKLDEKSDTGQKSYTFYFEGGLKSYVKHINKHHKPIHKEIFHTKGLDESEDIEVEVALQYTDDIQTREYSFANNIYTIDGGTHITGLRTALTRTINSYIEEHGSEKEKAIKISGDDIREGLTTAISIKIGEPQFEGQTKGKLNNQEVVNSVRSVVEAQLKNFLVENPKVARSIVDRVLLSSKARIAAKAAREAVVRKGALEGGGLPGKLADCSTKVPSESEIYIVEGDSAGGTAKQGRDRHTQAVFPLGGKPINAEKYRLDRILKNDEMADLVKALGCGIGDTFDISRLRYHTIVLMADADVDGEHINTLMLTMFYRYFKSIIEKGYLYIAQPPLYKVQFSANDEPWVKNDAELQKLISERKPKKYPNIQRFKGLGEMNPEQLWLTTMHPEKRTLKRVMIEDAEEADKMFDILMGESVPPRKKFIQTFSQEANLDI